MMKTAAYLRKRGVEIEFTNGCKIDWKNFDVFHNFNIHRDNASIIKEAKSNGLKLAISTIYWPSLKFALLGSNGIKEKLLAAASRLDNKLNPFSQVRKIVRSADALLPNSAAEGKILQSEFGARAEKIFVVPNAVDSNYIGDPAIFEKKFGLRDFVLYVGRIEPRKNVLGLVNAVKGTGLELAIIGEATHYSKAYAEQCRDASDEKVHFLGPMEHDSEILKSAFAAAKVFALPSWYETPSLAALEAGLNCCNIVITREGSTREYFGELAQYVNPNSVSDIREKILLASRKEKNLALAAKISAEFTWEKAAEKTLEAYEKILQK